MVKHLAIVMDGNRRWAKKNSLESFLGHYHGTKSAEKAINLCLEKNISYLSLWALSIENYYKRSKNEINYLFDLLTQLVEKNLIKYKDKKIKIKFIGDKSLYPESVLKICQKAENETKDNNKMQLNILFCYGGQQEIIAGLKSVVDDINSGKININDINNENFSNYLWLKDSPDPDIIIRTGNQHRLSNFILYKSAYSELFFLDCLWPDFKETHLEEVLDQFNFRKRNFGG